MFYSLIDIKTLICQYNNMEKVCSKQGGNPIRQLLKYRKCEVNVSLFTPIIATFAFCFKVKD